MAKVTFASTGTVVTAYLAGELDHHSVQLLRVEIDYQLQQRMPETLVLDFGAVTFMDSSGISLILGRSRRMAAMDGTVKVQRAPDSIRKLLELADVAYS